MSEEITLYLKAIRKPWCVVHCALFCKRLTLLLCYFCLLILSLEMVETQALSLHVGEVGDVLHRAGQQGRDQVQQEGGVRV